MRSTSSKPWSQVRYHFAMSTLPIPLTSQVPRATGGLQATAAENPLPKGAGGKKKGKKGAPRARQVRITNTHLKGVVDLSRDYVAPGK